MKKKYIFITIISVILIFFIVVSFIPKNNKNNITVLSDYLWVNYFDKNKEERINNAFSTDSFYYDYIYSSLDSSNLLKYLEEDTTKISSTKVSLQEQIKNSSILLLNIGMQDFINDIKVNTNMLSVSYEKNILSLRADIFINHYYNIINNLKLLNKDLIIYSTSLYYPFPYIHDDELINFFNLINLDIKEIIENENGVFVDISSYSQEKYLDHINDYKLNTIALNNIFNDILNLSHSYH